MGIWKLFARKRRAPSKRRKRRKPYNSQTKQALAVLKLGVERLQESSKSMKETMEEHASQLANHSDMLKNQSTKLEKLEQLVNVPEPCSVVKEFIPEERPDHIVDQSVRPADFTEIPGLSMNSNRLSPKEKRILGVFLANKDMALSYKDIAKSLGKSPHTIKNQIRQMNLKGSLFEKKVDENNQNRFKLKEGLKAKTAQDTD